MLTCAQCTSCKGTQCLRLEHVGLLVCVLHPLSYILRIRLLSLPLVGIARSKQDPVNNLVVLAWCSVFTLPASRGRPLCLTSHQTWLAFLMCCTCYAAMRRRDGLPLAKFHVPQMRKKRPKALMETVELLKREVPEIAGILHYTGQALTRPTSFMCAPH